MKKVLIKTASKSNVPSLMKLFMECNIGRGLRVSKGLADQLVKDGYQIYDIADEDYTDFISGLEQLELEHETVD